MRNAVGSAHISERCFAFHLGIESETIGTGVYFSGAGKNWLGIFARRMGEWRHGLSFVPSDGRKAFEAVWGEYRPGHEAQGVDGRRTSPPGDAGGAARDSFGA